jgi:hypothetical protein
LAPPPENAPPTGAPETATETAIDIESVVSDEDALRSSAPAEVSLLSWL